MKVNHTIFSVFEDIDVIVIRQMADEGKAQLIPLDQIPVPRRYNDAGVLAQCAAVIHKADIMEWDARVRELLIAVDEYQELGKGSIH